jgi:hypothetical protein
MHLEWAYLANLFVDLSACVHKSISHSSGWQSVFTRVIALFPLLAEGFRHPSFFFFQNASCIGESPSSREITPANWGASRSATQLVWCPATEAFSEIKLFFVLPSRQPEMQVLVMFTWALPSFTRHQTHEDPLSDPLPYTLFARHNHVISIYEARQCHLKERAMPNPQLLTIKIC